MEQQFKGVTLRAETTQRVRDFSGFKPSYRVPAAASKTDQRFLISIATEEINASVEDTYRAIRETFGYKRKEIEVAREQDYCEFITPDFVYRVTLVLDDQDPSRAIWRHEMTSITNEDVSEREEFMKRFIQLNYRFDKPVSIESFIDKLEDKKISDLKVDYDSAATFCDLQINKLPGILRVTKEGLLITGQDVLTCFAYFQKSLKAFLPSSR